MIEGFGIIGDKGFDCHKKHCILIELKVGHDTQVMPLWVPTNPSFIMSPSKFLSFIDAKNTFCLLRISLCLCTILQRIEEEAIHKRK